VIHDDAGVLDLADPFEMTMSRDDDATTFALTGELVFGSGLDRLPVAVVNALAAAPAPEVVRVDVSEIRRIDLDGVATLVRAQQRIASLGRRFSLVGAHDQVRRRLEIAGVLGLLERSVVDRAASAPRAR
jgi:ABC-type transporter Mla MlaB component